MREELLSELAERLSNFRVHERFISDLMKLVGKGGIAPRFFSLFYRRLEFLAEFGPRAHELHEEFERLDRNLYSMHVASRDFNIRILYSFLPDNTVLLLPFYERAGKSNTDYAANIDTAKRRLKELEGDT